MIIAVSIVDKHLSKGHRHVGTYMFEIDYPAASHEGQMDFLARDCPREYEAQMRPIVGRLLNLTEIPDPVRGDGTAVDSAHR